MRVRTFDSFRYRSYLLLWIASLCFSAGYWLQQIVVGWLTYEVTESAFWTTLALGIEALPILFMGPLGGVLVDRFNRKKLLASIYGYQAMVTTAFAVVVLTGHVEVWHIFLYIFLMGMSLVVSDPARVSLVANSVPKENLVNAFALSSMAFSLPRLAIPALGGVLIVLVGPGSALALMAGLQLSGVGALMGIRVGKGSRAGLRPSAVFSDLIEGVRYISREPVLMGLFALTILPSTLVMPSIHGLMPVYAAEVFQVDARGLGVLMSAVGAGSIVGTIVLASRGDIRQKNRVVLGGLIAMAMATAVFSVNGNFHTAYVNLIAISAAMMMYFSVNNATIHSIVPDEFRGRVAGIAILAWGLMPLGSLWTGFLAERLGPPHATQIGSGIMLGLLCIAVWKMRFLRRRMPNVSG